LKKIFSFEEVAKFSYDVKTYSMHIIVKKHILQPFGQ
jgi:hypothetical protein